MLSEDAKLFRNEAKRSIHTGQFAGNLCNKLVDPQWATLLNEFQEAL